MNVKVGDTIYEGNKEIVMVRLSPEDKKYIANMADDEYSYCNYPDGWTKEQVRQWMLDRKKKHLSDAEVIGPDGRVILKKDISEEE